MAGGHHPGMKMCPPGARVAGRSAQRGGREVIGAASPQQEFDPGVPRYRPVLPQSTHTKVFSVGRPGAGHKTREEAR